MANAHVRKQPSRIIMEYFFLGYLFYLIFLGDLISEHTNGPIWTISMLWWFPHSGDFATFASTKKLIVLTRTRNANQPCTIASKISPLSPPVCSSSGRGRPYCCPPRGPPAARGPAARWCAGSNTLSRSWLVLSPLEWDRRRVESSGGRRLLPPASAAPVPLPGQQLLGEGILPLFEGLTPAIIAI